MILIRPTIYPQRFILDLFFLLERGRELEIDRILRKKNAFFKRNLAVEKL